MSKHYMSKKIAAIFLALLCVLFPPVIAFAQAPDEVMREVIAKVKKTLDASPVVDYVRWDEAFSRMDAQTRMQMKVSSAEDLKEYYRQALKNPVAAMHNQLQAQIKNASPEDAQKIKEYLAKQEAQLSREQMELKKRIAATRYEVGSAKIEGNTASVKLVQNYNGEVSSEEVQMVKVGDLWLLPSVTAIAPKNEASRRAK